MKVGLCANNCQAAVDDRSAKEPIDRSELDNLRVLKMPRILITNIGIDYASKKGTATKE